jgi:hypothetical protein
MSANHSKRNRRAAARTARSNAGSELVRAALGGNPQSTYPGYALRTTGERLTGAGLYLAEKRKPERALLEQPDFIAVREDVALLRSALLLADPVEAWWACRGLYLSDINGRLINGAAWMLYALNGSLSEIVAEPALIELLRFIAIAEVAFVGLDAPPPNPHELERWWVQCQLLVRAAQE